MLIFNVTFLVDLFKDRYFCITFSCPAAYCGTITTYNVIRGLAGDPMYLVAHLLLHLNGFSRIPVNVK